MSLCFFFLWIYAVSSTFLKLRSSQDSEFLRIDHMSPARFYVCALPAPIKPTHKIVLSNCVSCLLKTKMVSLFTNPPPLLFQSFLENSHPAIQSLESLQNRAMEEFSKVASFFGEDGKSTRPEAFFGIFAEFMSKFEVSLFRQNIYLDALKAR